MEFDMKYLLIFVLLTLNGIAGPVELGKIDWERKLEPAIEQSSKDTKPIFLLFQEIPG